MRVNARTVSVIVCVQLIVSIGSLFPTTAQAAGLDGFEIAGTAIGAISCAIVAASVGPLGIAFAGITGGLGGAMAFGVGIEKLFLEGSSLSGRAKVNAVIAAAIAGFLIAAPLSAMLAAQLPLLGVIAAAVLGGSIGMQLGQSVGRPDKEVRPVVATGEVASSTRTAEAASPTEPHGPAPSMADLRQQCDDALRRLHEAIAKETPALVKEARNDYQRARQTLTEALQHSLR